MEKLLTSVKMFSAPEAKPTLTPMESTVTHFGTAGRILSFFPVVNLNGYTFEADKVSDDLVETLVGSTVDIQHVKPSYGISDSLVAGQKNTTFGAIIKAVKVPEGIDISTKLERAVAQAQGFTTDDFAPGQGGLANFSQECDFDWNDGEYIAVDKNDPSKIVSRWSYADGKAAGLELSHINAQGNWDYHLVDGNPIYFSVKPLSFSGVGHVSKPADRSAVTYKLAASLQLASYAGMDDVGYAASPDVYGGDFLSHPDILTADVDKYSSEPEDPKAPDDHYAAVYSKTDYGNVTDGNPSKIRSRSFRVKDDKGNFDRKRLVAGYRSLMGMRGDIDAANNLPPMVRHHALMKIRQGLKETKPIKPTSKETSSIHMEQADIDALKQKYDEIVATKPVAGETHQLVCSERDTLKAEVEKLKSQVEELTTTKDTLTASLEERDAKIKEAADKILASERLAELEAVLPFPDEEKSAEPFQEFVKSLASMSPQDYKIEKLTRENQKLAAAVKAKPDRLVASTPVIPTVNPVPEFKTGDSTKLSFDSIY